MFKTFKAGDLVPTSGMYAALHSTPHTLIKYVIYVEGEAFRRCRMCPFGVLYRFEKPCVPISATLPICLRRAWPFARPCTLTSDVYAHIKDEFGGSYATSITAFGAAAQRLLGRRTELSEPNQPESDEFEPNSSLNR